MNGTSLRSSPVFIAIVCIGPMTFFYTSGFFIENLIRSLIAFLIVPLAILFANTRHFWFLHSLRWMVYFSHKLLLSIIIFTVGVLLSYELLNLMPTSIGFIIHAFILTISSMIYWAPLLVNCPFRKPREYADKVAYFTVTCSLFFIYHQGTFLYYDSSPTLGFMIAGLTVMLITLLYLFIAWYQSEEQIDRPTVEGHIRSIPTEKNS
ncbi:hypothetical protein [Halobacillus sp. B23F22_1]|uniref:hypothetical protein n=1 Tax=Halobacillus sp. B23F22_1 TaxID=3459514 RepID=UPI00373F6343